MISGSAAFLEADNDDSVFSAELKAHFMGFLNFSLIFRASPSY